MMNATLLELYVKLRERELQQRRYVRPSAPAKPGAWRRRLARGLIALGLRLDADASRAALGRIETTPRLHASDA